jgi:hypothetical protein
MNAFVKFGAAALVFAAAAPASAGSVAACLGHSQDRNGVTSFDGYTVAVSAAADVDAAMLRQEAETGFEERYGDPGRVICETHSGSGHYVVVGGGVELNGAVRNLIGFGFGPTRSAALADSDNRLNNIHEYNVFQHSGGRLTILEEGEIGG